MTFAELKTEVFRLLGEDQTTPVHFTEAEIGRAINDTIRRMAYESGCLEIEHRIDIASGTAVYTLPPNVWKVFRVAYDNERIGPASTHELDRYDRGWEGRSGLVQVYYLDRIEHDQIGVWRVPDAENRVVFDAELGTIVRIPNSTVHMRFQSKRASLGTTVDFDQDADTVVFAAAAQGGGADADFGTVVDISSDETGAAYTFASELGVIVDLDETTSNKYDAEIFIESLAGGTAGESTADTEYGIVCDIDTDDGSDVYLFSTEVGVVVDFDNPEQNLRVWAKEDPADLVDSTDVPRLPVHAHQGVVFGAAGKALLKHSEIRNEALGTLYMALEKDYTQFLRRLSVRRTPERTHRMREATPDHRLTRVHPRLPGEYPRTLH